MLLSLGAAITGLLWTRDTGAVADVAPKPGDKRAAKETGPLPRERRVDMRPLQTARRVVALATTREELEYAHQAERLANHSVDLAFTDALRQAAESAPVPTPQIKELEALKAKAEDVVQADQKRIKQLAQRLAKAPEQEQDALEDQLEVAKAQLELDQDELADASEDLERAGGDPQAKIRRLKEAHDAAEKQEAAASELPANVSVSSFQAGSLLYKLRAWTFERSKGRLLEAARQEALDKAQRLIKRRDTLAKRVKDGMEAREDAKRAAQDLAHQAKAGATSKEDAKAALDSLKAFMGDQRTLTAVNKRMRDQLELGDVYASWGALAQTYQRAALHRLIQGLMWILAVLAAVFILDRVVEHLFGGLSQEKLRVSTLRTMLKFSLQCLGALVILFMVIGMPSQATTILGLAGAGLTVALKDFIVAFFGWFVLMGRNGIRVGDWVEIKGVGGEVVEVGLLRTVLLETGAWSDSGHPTGRRVAFVNSFAMEGHYFNFSTSGQWMWDELSALVPAGEDPYPIIDGVQKLVEAETAANAKEAEAEWRKATKRYRVQAFTATPGINVVPTANGVELRVRYITRAFERHEKRRNLYQAIVALMHGKRPEQDPKGPSEAAPAVS